MRNTFAAAATAVSLAVSLAAVAPAFAQGTGSEGFFEVHNTTDHVLVGFYSNDGSGWSMSWLDAELHPGEAVVLEFVEPEGACEQILRAGWLADGGGGEVLDDPIRINICEASRIYLGDNDIWFD